MHLEHMKRRISLLLAIVLLISLLPVQVFATEEDPHVHGTHAQHDSEFMEVNIPAPATEAEPTVEATQPVPATEAEPTVEATQPVPATEAEPVAEELTPLQQLQTRADDLMIAYFGSTTVNDQQISKLVYELPDARFYQCQDELRALIPLLDQVTDEDLQAFGAANPSFVAFADAIMEGRSSGSKIRAASSSVLNGQVTVSDEKSNVSVSGNTVTVSLSVTGGLLSSKQDSNTVTVTNTSGKLALLSFDYSCSSNGTYSFSAANPGSYSGMLEAGGSITFTMTATGDAGWSTTKATLTLSNFQLTIPKESSNITIVYDHALGSIKANDTAVSSGDTLENVSSTAGVTLTATPASGNSFVCWINSADNTVVSTDASFTYQPENDITLNPVFSSSGTTAYFRIQNRFYFSLEDALSAASNGDVLILMNNGTLQAGDYTIPNGITLLVPFDANGTLYTTQPAADSATTTPSAYRTLTLARGANLTVNGAMSVSAKHYRSGGRPVGKYGHVALQEGSSIKVTGNLYAYGYITGTGSVKIMSGASVYEYFQITDFRGGTATLNMNGNSNEVFPLSQYYIQNVEAPMTLEAGASEYGYTTLYANDSELHSTVKFIGTSGAMFNLTSGSVTKQYDGTTDRLLIKANGAMSLEPISLSLKVVITVSLNSNEYILPINSNITIALLSGTATIKQDLALLPEAQVIIHPNATCKLASGVRLYVYDNDQWGNYVYGGVRLKAAPYAASRTYKSATSSSRSVASDASIQVAGTLDASSGKLYTTQSGAAITGVEGGKVKMASVSSGSTYQATQSGTDVSYSSIAVTSAKLQNTDGTYTETSANTYSYEDGFWQVSCDHNYTVTNRIDATCSADGSITYTCSKCSRSYSETIPSTGHTAGEAVTENVVAATCTAGGSYDSVVYCSVCGETLSRQKITTDSVGHAWDDGAITTAPTCTAAGVKTIRCATCGDSYTEDVSALGHDMVYTATKDPTCTEDGQSASAYCSRGDYVEESGGSIPALGHNWVQTAKVDATCTSDGSITYQCSRCSDTKTDPIQSSGHNYTPTVTAPTCEEKGYTTHTCSVCKASYKDSYVDALEHTYDGVTTAPTCEDKGFTTYTCSVCSDTYVGNEVDALGHDYGDGTVTLPATCTDAGNRRFTCALCNDSYDEVIPSRGHTLTYHNAKLASYTSVGWDAYETCSVCDHTTYKEYPMLSRKSVADYETFLKDLQILEEVADSYVEENPAEDPLALVLNYIRTGIASYTTADWAIMAGNENTDFTAYVTTWEDAYNTLVTDPAELISVVSLRDLEHFAAPSDPSFKLELSHMFGTMDITGHNPGSVNHADVAGWSGDLVDLLDLMDTKTDVTGKNTVEEMIDVIFAKEYIAGPVEAFGQQDMYGDLDAFYIMQELDKREYYNGLLTEIVKNYFVQGLTDADRASYFIENRLGGVTSRSQLRAAVYEQYVGNKLNTTLEGTRTFKSDSVKLYDLRMACCYAFADYLWKLSGDYVQDDGNSSFTVTSSEVVTLAPGIVQHSASATAADGANLNYFVTVADLNQDTVRIDAAVGNATALTLAKSHTANVIAGINGGAVSAAGSCETAEQLTQILSGTILVRDGKSVAAAGDSRTSGTMAGVTRTGKAVLATVDQATQAEMARILLDAGCETAFLLDSGAKTSYVSRRETENNFTDHTQNTAAVSSVLLLVSTAADDTAFDHAVLEADYTYLTANAAVQLRAYGVTARGTRVEIPQGTLNWSVSDSDVGSIDANGKFTAAAIGDTEVSLRLNGQKIGTMTLHVVLPDTLYFAKSNIIAYYGEATALPLAAKYQRKPVAITAEDVRFTVSSNDDGVSGGTVNGFNFTGNESSGLKTVRITAALAKNSNITDTLSVTMYQQGDVAFDFNNATGGNRQLAWLRTVSNSTTEDNNIYYVVDTAKPMVVDYTLAIDMSAIAVPAQLKDLTSMLPGADSTDGTAWGFLLQLADRISPMSQVTAEIQLDPNFDADLSGLTLQNEYLRISSLELDEETNLLRVTMSWIKQSAAIDPATANPVCVVSGIKLTPKEDAAWNENSSMTPVNSGTLRYQFHLSAGALYTFASDPVNQTQYGLTPYINPDNSSDRGAYFGADYTSFQDSFTLINALKNGWYFEEGENVFYVDGVLHTEHTPKSSVTTQPTCTTDGYTSNVCAVCEITYITDEIGALGHTEVTDTAVAPTCTATGLTEGKHCSVCNTVLKAQETVPAKGHTEVTDTAVAPTCTATGLTEGQHCSVCNTVLKAQETVPAKGHTEVTDTAVAPTCTATGLTEGKHCSVCNTVLKAQETVPAKGHTEVTDTAVAPTCTATGLTEGKHCSVCNTVLKAQETVPAKGHTEVTDTAVAPTCTATGLTEGQHCSVCNTVLKAQETVPAKNHSDADTNFICDACGADLCTNHEEEVIPAQAATCTTAGLTEGKRCKICGEIIVAQTVVTAKGHTEVTDKAVAPTCTATGLTEGKHCSVCNTVLVAQQTVAAKGHTEVTDKAVAPTCTATGLTEGKHCSVCNTVLKAQETVPAKGHTEVTDTAVAPTCTATGLTEGKHCSICNTVIVAQQTVPATGIHSYVNSVCRHCGAAEPVEEIEKFNLSGATMTLDNSLAINFVIDMTKLTGDGHYAKITKEYADGRADAVITVAQEKWKVYSGNLYYFAFDGVAAKEMTDAITVVVYNRDGVAVTNEWHDSVRDYAMRALVKEEGKASADREKLALYVDMMRYGAAAQDYFEDYHISDLADSQLSSAQKAYATTQVTMTNQQEKGEGYAGTTLTLESRIILNFVYHNTALEGVTHAVAVYTNHYGNPVSSTIAAADFKSYSDTMTYIPVSGMAVADCGQLVTLTLYDANDKIVSTSCDSVESYISRIANANELYSKIIRFAYSAYMSFH